MRSNSTFVVWLLAGHVLQHQRPCVDLKISHQCISLDPLPRAGQVFFFVRFIGTDPNASQLPPESPLSLHPTIFKLLSQDLDISQQFLFLFSHPSILWNCHIYNLTALFALVNDQQIRTPGPEFMVCSGTEVAQKVIIVIFKRTLPGTWPYHLSFGSNPHFPARS